MVLVCGVGKNDADYEVQPRVNGKQTACPIYVKWKSMLERCYSDKVQRKHPTYKGCSVTEEWLTFSNFRSWMIRQDWEGNALDKDILLEGNKIYGPETCAFISSKLNSLLNEYVAGRGDQPLGINKHGKNYQARITKLGKRVQIGTFKTPEAAHDAYRAAKADVIELAANEQNDMRIRKALMKRVENLRKPI